MSFHKKVAITSNNLGGESPATLMLTFTPPTSIHKALGVCWKLGTFLPTGMHDFQATYVSQLAFSVPQIEGEVIVGPAAATTIDLGQSTILTVESGELSFSAPVKDPKVSNTHIKATNSTDKEQTMGVGFQVKPTDMPSIAAVFKGVPVKSWVDVDFHPILNVYVYSGVVENEIITGEITGPLLISQNLAELAKDSVHWLLTRDPVTGEYKLTEPPAL